MDNLADDTTKAMLCELLSDELLSLVDCFEIRDFPKGTVLWRIGDPADFLGLIVQGEVALKKNLPAYGKSIIIEMLWEHEFLGECTLNPSACRETTAEIMQPCRLAILTKATLNELRHKDMASLNILLQKVLTSVGRRLTRMSNRLTRLF